ncbi:winged helix-turn-helix domain-containing protein [Brevibacterium sp. GP-SGM9]|uniref:winged helix-turn-helix domain-containing protein n=1 Tax=unclassified Brevibacterium TaxID=2614124 RepID=UPI001E3D99CA|nr:MULTISPECIES: winged-helix domain-containing protein [unclassified Brevibacterium]MCD1285319.1 transcriptional regulator [Brevibacterium sp. CCUG 69071]MDK8434366.1 winged-helix domain-containing protein [Brevibacterium sp. H-BE7]
MRILHISPAARLDAPLAPESLQYLGHHIERRDIAHLSTAAAETITADVVIADACLDLSLAPAIAEVLTARNLTVPVIVVLSEGGLATASARWNVSDIVLTSAGPAEVEARLRMARDRGLSPAQAGAGFAGRSGYTGRANLGEQTGGGGAVGPSATGGAYGTPGAEAWNADGEPMVVVTGALRIDETAFTADLGGRSLDLTYREFALLKFFAMHPERVFTRDEILFAVWGDDYYGGTRTVDVHVRRLRAKLGKDLENAIHTVRNVGYRFSADSMTDDDDEAAEADETERRSPHETSEENEPSEEDLSA